MSVVLKSQVKWADVSYITSHTKQVQRWPQITWSKPCSSHDTNMVQSSKMDRRMCLMSFYRESEDFGVMLLCPCVLKNWFCASTDFKCTKCRPVPRKGDLCCIATQAGVRDLDPQHQPHQQQLSPTTVAEICVGLVLPVRQFCCLSCLSALLFTDW